jgi:hypothetical protein
MKSLATSILEQRSELEQFFMEALHEVSEEKELYQIRSDEIRSDTSPLPA